MQYCTQGCGDVEDTLGGVGTEPQNALCRWWNSQDPERETHRVKEGGEGAKERKRMDGSGGGSGESIPEKLLDLLLTICTPSSEFSFFPN